MLITYSYRTYPRTQPVWSIGRSERDRLARSRYRRMAAGPVRNISRMQFKNTSDITLQTDTNRHDNEGELHAKLMSSDRAASCCLLPRQISGRREACPPARRPRRELRSARRLEARPGPAGLATASNRSGCLCVAWPGPAAAHRHRGQAPPPRPGPAGTASRSPPCRCSSISHAIPLRYRADLCQFAVLCHLCF